MLSWGGAAMFWLWAQAAFDDDFELRPWHAAPWLALAGGGLVATYAGPLWPTAARAIGVAQPWLALELVLLAAAQTVKTWRADLVMRRRRLRVAVVAGTVVYSATATLLGLPASPLRTAWNLRGALEAATLCALAVMVAWSLLRIDARDYLGAFAPAEADPQPPPASPAGSPAADPALLRRLDRLMIAERIYRREGLTIGALAAKLGAGISSAPGDQRRPRPPQPTYSSAATGSARRRRRSVIPARRTMPVLTIAMDAGFQSIGPFNRAFKAAAGMTPTEYRKIALSAFATRQPLVRQAEFEFTRKLIRLRNQLAEFRTRRADMRGLRQVLRDTKENAMHNLIFAIPAACLTIAASIWLLPSAGSLEVGGVNILPWILPGVFTFALAEAIVLSLRSRRYDWKSWFVSSALAIEATSSALPRSASPGLFALAWQHRIATVQIGPWWSFALLILGQELCYYWLHRASHHIRWFWATHAVHHSPNEYNLAAAFRLRLDVETVGRAIFNLPLIWLGFRPDIVGATILFTLLYQFWLHFRTRAELGHSNGFSIPPRTTASTTLPTATTSIRTSVGR